VGRWGSLVRSSLGPGSRALGVVMLRRAGCTGCRYCGIGFDSARRVCRTRPSGGAVFACWVLFEAWGAIELSFRIACGHWCGMWGRKRVCVRLVAGMQLACGGPGLCAWGAGVARGGGLLGLGAPVVVIGGRRVSTRPDGPRRGICFVPVWSGHGADGAAVVIAYRVIRATCVMGPA